MPSIGKSFLDCIEMPIYEFYVTIIDKGQFLLQQRVDGGVCMTFL